MVRVDFHSYFPHFPFRFRGCWKTVFKSLIDGTTVLLKPSGQGMNAEKRIQNFLLQFELAPFVWTESEAR